MVETVKIASLKPAAYNPRRISKSDMASLKRSLEEFGAVDPAVVNSDDTIIGGHQRIEAARELGWTEFPIVRVDLDKDRERLLNLALNRISGSWDSELLSQLVSDLAANGAPVGLSGFDSAEIDELIESIANPLEVPDVEAVPADEAETSLGDVIELGDHRLICGDCTDASVVSKVLAGRSIDLLLTDPPYGVSYSQKANSTGDTAHRDIANDDLTGAALQRLLEGAFVAASKHMDGGAPAYVFLSDAHRLEVQAAMERSSLSVHQTLIWVKNQFVLGRQDYQPKHEPILYGWKDGAAHRWYGGFDQGSVFDHSVVLEELSRDQLLEALAGLQTSVLHFDRPRRSEYHPTTKPIDLLERLIKNSSQFQDLVFDPFVGSGSTLLACELTGRHAFCVELDPRYCDVVIQRWEAATGKDAIRLGS